MVIRHGLLKYGPWPDAPRVLIPGQALPGILETLAGRGHTALSQDEISLKLRKKWGKLVLDCDHDLDVLDTVRKFAGVVLPGKVQWPQIREAATNAFHKSRCNADLINVGRTWGIEDEALDEALGVMGGDDVEADDGAETRRRRKRRRGNDDDDKEDPEDQEGGGGSPGPPDSNDSGDGGDGDEGDPDEDGGDEDDDEEEEGESDEEQDSEADFQNAVDNISECQRLLETHTQECGGAGQEQLRELREILVRLEGHCSRCRTSRMKARRTIDKQSKRLDQREKAKEKYRRSSKRWEKLNAKQLEIIKQLKLKELDRDWRKGKKRRYFSLFGGFTLAVRRCLCNGTAHSMGLCLGLDIHGSTINRWTLLMRAAHLAELSCVHMVNYSLMDLPAEEGDGVRVALHLVQFDATNAAIWMNMKLHTMLLQSDFLLDPVRHRDVLSADGMRRVLSKRSYRILMGELQKVRSAKGNVPGMTMLGMIEKQLGSIMGSIEKLWHRSPVVVAPAPVQPPPLAVVDAPQPAGIQDGIAPAIEVRLPVPGIADRSAAEDPTRPTTAGGTSTQSTPAEAGAAPLPIEADDDGLDDLFSSDDSDEDEHEDQGELEKKEEEKEKTSLQVLELKVPVFSLRNSLVQLPERKAADICLKIWAFTSDHGSDCAAARLRAMAEIDLRGDDVLGVEIDCLLHQFHIISCHHLHLADEHLMPAVRLEGLKYYSSLAKCTHLWREHSGRVMKIWEEKFGAVAAWKNCRHVVPAPISGRWGRSSAVEKFILERDVDKVLWCLKKLCEEIADDRGAKKGKGKGSKGSKEEKKKTDEEEVAEALDEVRVEEMQARRKKLGKWARDCLQVLQHPDRFGLAILLAQGTRAPLDHLMNFIEGNREFCLAKLVWGKGREIAADIHDLASADPEALIGRALPSGVRKSRVQSAVTTFALRISANYDRRILGRLESFPVRLLWLAKGCCLDREPMRAVVAKELLELRPGSANVSALKIARMFRSELLECFHSGGQLRATLLTPMLMLAERWRPDSQEVESMNKMVSVATHANPKISLEQLDARVGLRKALRLGCRASINAKFSDVSAHADAAIRNAMNASHGMKMVMEREDRFALPEVCSRRIQLPPPLVPLGLDLPALTWARPWNSAWRIMWKEGRDSFQAKAKALRVLALEEGLTDKRVPTADESEFLDSEYREALSRLKDVLIFPAEKEGEEVQYWVVGDVYRYQGFFYRCDLVPVEGGSGSTGGPSTFQLRLREPRALRSSLEVFASLHHRLQGREDDTVEVQMRAIDFGVRASDSTILGALLDDANRGVLQPTWKPPPAPKVPDGSRSRKHPALQDEDDNEEALPLVDLMRDGWGLPVNGEEEDIFPSSDVNKEADIRKDQVKRAKKTLKKDKSFAGKVDKVIEKMRPEKDGWADDDLADIVTDVGIAHELCQMGSAIGAHVEEVEPAEPKALTEEDVDSLYTKWCVEAARGVACMRHWHESQALHMQCTDGVMGLKAPHFSLVQYRAVRGRGSRDLGSDSEEEEEKGNAEQEDRMAAKVGFIEWKRPLDLGYEVNVSSSGKPLAPAFGKGREIFRLIKRDDDMVLVQPDVGVGFTYGRSKRKVIPPESLRLQRSWDAALTSESGGGQMKPCTRCDDATEVWGSDSVVSICPLCLLPWHSRCVEDVEAASSSRTHHAADGLALGSLQKLPPLFNPDSMCALCTRWVREGGLVERGPSTGRASKQPA
jgi:hypothetical protein